MLKKRLRIISLLKKRNALYLKNTHKFGIEVPNYVAKAHALYKNDGKTLCGYSIAKEMKDVSPIFVKLDSGDIVPIGYQSVNCHMIFGVIMEYFCRKARLVAGRHVP